MESVLVLTIMEQEKYEIIILINKTCRRLNFPLALFFSHEIARPHLKASQRKTNSVSKLRRRKSTLLTDTPEKKKLIEEEFESKQKKKVKPPTKKIEKKREMKDIQNRNKGKITRKTGSQDYSSDDEECFCLICTEPFSKSLSGEKWIQCILCNGWAQVECTRLSRHESFTCQNCDSDDDVFLYKV